MSELFQQTGQLLRLTIRRDRIRALIWVLSLTFITIVIPSTFKGLYSSQSERDIMAETMENPAMIAMVGQGDLENYTVGAMTAHQMLLLTSVFVAIMSILLFVRHTRTDEEEGRIELIRALPVGRLSTIHATTIYLVLVNVLLAVLVAAGLYVQSIEGMGLEGSILYGLTLGGTGICFTAIAAVFTQLSESSRGVIGWSIALLLFFYVLRAVGDIGNEILSLISPLGWINHTMIYTENNWWPILLMVVFSVVLLAIAYQLNAKRDLEAGLLPSKPGKAHASKTLLSPFGLAFRLQRTAFISWAFGMLFLGLSYGSVLGDLESFFQGNEMITQIFGQEEGYSMTEQFVSMIITIMAMIATIPAIISINKLYGEEKKSRLELTYSKPVSRKKMILSYLLVALMNAFVGVFMAGFGMWAAGSAVMDESISFGLMVGSSLAYLPAMLVMVGIATLFIGGKPSFVSVIWAYLVYSFIVVYMGDLFQFDDWLKRISPFGNIPEMPMDNFSLLPLVIVSAIAVSFACIGVFLYSKRDIQG